MYYEVKEFMELILLILNDKTESDINSQKNSYQAMQVMDEVRRMIGLIYPSDKESN